jgi:diguanylate cyclase (GGDEF)-like protein
MKQLGLLIAVFLVCALPAAWAETPAPLTTLRAVAALTNVQASQHMPATFEATVVYYRYYDNDLFVQDGGAAIYVRAGTNLHLAPGDRVLVRGTVHESFRPYVDSHDITRLGHGALPEPAPATYQEMIRGEADCKLVTVRAHVLSAEIVPNSALRVPAIFLQMLVDGGHVDANVDSNDPDALKALLDADVQITGAVSGHFDNKMQQTGILLHVQALADIKIMQQASVDPWSLAVTPMDRLITGYRVLDLAQRMHIHGTITYYQPGSALVLQDRPRSVWVATSTYAPLRIGDVADAIGFPDVQNGFLALARSEVRDSSVAAPVMPSLFTWRELASGGNNAHSHAFDLVSIEGEVVAEVRQATQDEYVLDEDGHLFSAIFRHPGTLSADPLLPMRQVPAGARIRVTGVCMLEDANPFNGDVPFNILMRSYDDIAVVARPSPLNVRNLIILVALLLVVVFAVGVWSWYLERKRRHENAALAYLERRRSLVLEELNGSRPLGKIIEQITELVSYKLRGASSWCEIIDGTSFGQRPAIITSQRIIQQEICGCSGAPLGTLFAALPRFVKPSADESAALALGTGLAKLTIETSNLYRDLVYRSEFDLLTDIPNRFSLEKQLDTQIEEARASAGVFGFIFIDLDRFKQVNDQYGHYVGDLYLQAVAQRMKRQLRPGDMLARLGGDEFAVVAPAVRGRTEVEEIASRLERCFDEPFAAEGRIIYGAASVGIALYPEDATNRDGLLSTADAAMYAAKQSRKGLGLNASGNAAPDLASMRCA